MRVDAAKIGLIVLSVASLGLLGLLGLHLRESAAVKQISIAAGERPGESYVLIQALKSVSERHFPKLRIDIRESGGTAENLRLLEGASVDLATAQADAAAGAAARMVAILYEDTFQLAVHRDSAIRNFADLRGKRIALPKSGGQYRSFLHVAQHFRMLESDFVFAGANEAEANRLFQEHKADAVFRVRALGNPEMLWLLKDGDVQFVRIPQAKAMKIALPALEPSIIPEGAYSGDPPLPPADLETVAVQRTLLAHRNADPDAVRTLLSVLMERRQEIAREIPEARAEVRTLLAGVKRPENQSGLGSPVHEGAQAYYDKDKPAFIQQNADLLALALTIVLLGGSWIWELRRWILRNQKNAGDEFNHSLVELIDVAQKAATPAEVESVRRQLMDMLGKVVVALDVDEISEESFQSFRVIWQIALDLVRERRDILQNQHAHDEVEPK
jgi:uncharacterized protein